MYACCAGVAGYSYVAVLHVGLGLTFKTTLLLANTTSIAWLCIYYGVLPRPEAQAVSQLHTLSSRDSDALDGPARSDQHGRVADVESVRATEGFEPSTVQVGTAHLQLP